MEKRMSILEEKMKPQDTILDEVTRKQLIWCGRENAPNDITKNYG